MMSFAYSRYGEADAALLAQNWCDRMQHWYDIYVAADDVGYQFGAQDVESYEEPEAFTAWAATLAPTAPASERLAQLRAMRPRGA